MGKWAVRLGLIFGAILWMTLIAASYADAAENKDDEYSFSWLDPDKKIYVLQNRRYRKANRLMVTASVGTGLTIPYRTAYNLDPRIGYYLSDALGIEVFYQMTMNQKNTIFEALRLSNTNVWPQTREIQSQTGALVHWVPWYAKINVFNKILYFDWYFSGGVGVLNTKLEKTATTSVAQNFTALILGTGHQYFLIETWLVRLYLGSAPYRAPLMGETGDPAWFSNLNFNFGVGLRL